MSILLVNIISTAVLMLVLSILLVNITCTANAASVNNVVLLGAKGDGVSDSTQPFLQAWTAACTSSAARTTVYVPNGTFLIKPINFSGPCNSSSILFQINGTIVAPPDYHALGNTSSWISFCNVSQLTLHGGTINGSGAPYWSCRRTTTNCTNGVKSITFQSSNNVVVRGLTSLWSKSIHVAVNECSNITFQNIRIRAPSKSPNTDGINVQHSTGVTISGSMIETGDDCIAIGPGSKNIWIERIACGPGHGISIGSLGNWMDEEGVQNVTVTNIVFTKAYNGVRIKTWPRASNSYATNIEFRNILMRDVSNPIIIDQTYCPHHNQCPGECSGVQVSQVIYRNITGTSAKLEAVKLLCSPSKPCWGIKLQDIKLITPNRKTIAKCDNAYGFTVGSVIPPTSGNNCTFKI